ncbi:MAG: hypothetical protein KIS87_05315 [Phycisphaeraceae bacterium]|nr:hypothetical protein [Phycisphaeraceae bacterium]
MPTPSAPTPPPARAPAAAPPRARSWSEVVDRASPRLRALLAGVEAGSLEGDPILLHAPPRSVPLIEPQREAIERLIRDVTGRRARVELRERDESTGDPPDPGSRPQVAVTDHPLVKAALEVFEGSLGRVTPKRPKDS